MGVEVVKLACSRSDAVHGGGQPIPVADDLAVVYVSGGLCSQLQKYTVGEYLKKHVSARIKYDLEWFETSGLSCDKAASRKFQLKELFPDMDFEAASKDESEYLKRHNCFCNPHGYVFCPELVLNRLPLYVDGYYESVAYMNDVKEVLYRTIDFSKIPLDDANEAVLDSIRNASHSCAVHVRRGDYVSIGMAFLTPEYYAKAVDLIEEKAKGAPVKFFFFSNDVGYVQNEIIPKCRKGMDYVVVDANDNDTGYLDLYLISKCDDQISSNSSFGFWGAFLNRNPRKAVVFPSRWTPGNGVTGKYAAMAHYMEGAVFLDENGNHVNYGKVNPGLGMSATRLLHDRTFPAMLFYAFRKARACTGFMSGFMFKKKFWTCLASLLKALRPRRNLMESKGRAQ